MKATSFLFIKRHLINSFIANLNSHEIGNDASASQAQNFAF